LKKITEAKELASVLSKTSWVAAVEPVETNILIFSLAPHCNDQALEIKAKKYFHQFYGTWELRIVTHLDYREVMHTYF
jgi:threonine aldolase